MPESCLTQNFEHPRCVRRYNTPMASIRPNKRGQLFLTILLVLIGSIGYVNYRQQVFELFASGTQWVLVTCGFVPDGDENNQSERFRNLYYAVRMYNEAPARELSPKDQQAAQRYPGMGFGLIHTFDTRPISAVIGGWLFAIPCIYFIDSRDCNKAPTSARLKIGIADFEPISLETIEQFLAVASPEIVHITISGAESRLRNKNQPGVEQYTYVDDDTLEAADHKLLCMDTDSVSAINVMDHCLLVFNYSKDTIVELKFDARHRSEVARLKHQARELVSSFQVRQ